MQSFDTVVSNLSLSCVTLPFRQLDTFFLRIKVNYPVLVIWAYQLSLSINLRLNPRMLHIKLIAARLEVSLSLNIGMLPMRSERKLDRRSNHIS